MAEKKRLLQIMDLIKMLPRTNCKECGYPSCMAFATHVLRENENPDKCPYWSAEDLAAVKKALLEQGDDTAYPDHLGAARKFVQEKIKDYNFSSLAVRLQAEFGCDEQGEYLRINLLGRFYRVGKEQVTLIDGGEHDLWEHVLLYNYIAEAGGRPLIGNWVPMESLPGSLAKRKVFASGCEDRIAAVFSGRGQALVRALTRLGARFPELDSNADVAAVFYPLPLIPFQLLFWDADTEDGFPAQVKILFDETVLDYLDIESLVFLGQKSAERLEALGL